MDKDIDIDIMIRDGIDLFPVMVSLQLLFTAILNAKKLLLVTTKSN